MNPRQRPGSTCRPARPCPSPTRQCPRHDRLQRRSRAARIGCVDLSSDSTVSGCAPSACRTKELHQRIGWPAAIAVVASTPRRPKAKEFNRGSAGCSQRRPYGAAKSDHEPDTMEKSSGTRFLQPPRWRMAGAERCNEHRGDRSARNPIRKNAGTVATRSNCGSAHALSAACASRGMCLGKQQMQATIPFPSTPACDTERIPAIRHPPPRMARQTAPARTPLMMLISRCALVPRTMRTTAREAVGRCRRKACAHGKQQACGRWVPGRNQCPAVRDKPPITPSSAQHLTAAHAPAQRRRTAAGTR